MLLSTPIYFIASPFGPKLQKRAARLALDESMSTPVYLFRKLEWIPNLIKMRKILLIVNTLRSSSPSDLRKLFCFSGALHDVYTRSSVTDLIIPSVKSNLSKTKLSYSGVLLFNSLSNDLKVFNDYSPSAYKHKLKRFFSNLNYEVDHLEQFSCILCKNLVIKVHLLLTLNFLLFFTNTYCQN